MGLIGGSLGYALLKRIAPGGVGYTTMDGSVYANRSKIEVLLGSEVLDSIKGKFVVDFGCGEGTEALELARHGARRVIGVDSQDRFVEEGRRRALAAKLDHIVTFEKTLTETADVVVSIDSFEHFDDPAAILELVAKLLRDDGVFHVSFGPTWYHPKGGHLFSVFPWAHLVFTERSLIRWRSDFKTDGATKFSEVAGGLNMMTIARFEKLVSNSPLRAMRLEAIPIRRFKAFHNGLTREFLSAIVRATLVHRR